MNPSMSEAAIRRRLKLLQCNEIVTSRALSQGRRIEGYPVEFYELTHRARTIFDTFGLFPESAWRREFARVEKTDRIRCLEQEPGED